MPIPSRAASGAPSFLADEDVVYSDARKTKFKGKVPTLNDGVNPAWKSWLILIRGRLRYNSDHYPTEDERMFLIYESTEGKAEAYLRPRYEVGSPDPFQSYQEMLEYLGQFYQQPFERQLALGDYHSLKKEAATSFAEFHSTFLSLAATSGIPSSQFLEDIKTKLDTRLAQMTLSDARRATTFQEYCEALFYADSDIQSRREERKNEVARVEKQAKKLGIASSSGSGPRPPFRSARANTSTTVEKKLYSPASTSTSFGSNDAGKARSSTPGSQPTCYNCNKVGHIKPNCPELVSLKEMTLEDGQEQLDEGSGFDEESQGGSEQGKEDA